MIAPIIIGAVVILIAMYVMSKKPEPQKIMLNTSGLNEEIDSNTEETRPPTFNNGDNSSESSDGESSDGESSDGESSDGDSTDDESNSTQGQQTSVEQPSDPQHHGDGTLLGEMLNENDAQPDVAQVVESSTDKETGMDDAAPEQV